MSYVVSNKETKFSEWEKVLGMGFLFFLHVLSFNVSQWASVGLLCGGVVFLSCTFTI